MRRLGRHVRDSRRVLLRLASVERPDFQITARSGRLNGRRSLKKSSIEYSVHGIRLPYCMSKRLFFSDERTLRIDYCLDDLSSHEMDYIWAGHMMLAAEKGCRVVVPAHRDRCACTMSESALIGSYGESFTYPIVRRPDGTLYDASLYRGDGASDYQKLSFVKVTKRWAAIKYPNGIMLSIRFPSGTVPYLAPIQAEGAGLNTRYMFPEPRTGAFDRPDLASLHVMNSSLPPYSNLKWSLEIAVRTEVWKHEIS